MTLKLLHGEYRDAGAASEEPVMSYDRFCKNYQQHVPWFNTERTHGSIDDLTPLEVEQLDYARNEPVERAG
ncbi:hypothetical protein [Microbacterium esteraromaticum]|uniref:hypothetical protein n=1 Tax=Microbacterium esteraromaticum TaxID=57043 RepID=UPI001C940B3B|nr:hypothetical protein [Microbacterium esteraromaticum]MBY6060316.1 hypothetical protein [Microbacterium esteraromaticum]